MDGKKLQTNFTTGELMPKLWGRVDLEALQNGAALIKNMTVAPQGGAFRRLGLEFIAEVKDSTKITRLIDFEFSTTQSYAIELGDQSVRFYRNGGIITETAVNISGGITNANPGEVTAASHGYSNGDHVYLADVVGMEAVNGQRFTVANQAANTFELSGIDTTNYGTYSSGGTCAKVYEVAAPWLEAELFAVDYAQDADVMWLCHPGHKTRKLTRVADTNWTITNYAPTADPFASADNYPATVWFFEQRILFANTNTDPQKIWASVSGDFEDMSPGTAAAGDAWSYVIASGQVNRIQWIRGTEELLIGSSAKEFKGTGLGEPITPTNINIRPQTSYGTQPAVAPLDVENTIIFMQRGARRLRQIFFDPESLQGSLIARNASILAEHLTDCGCINEDHGIIDMALQDQPSQIVWCVTEDGRLIGMTTEREHQVTAWHRHETQGTFESVTSISHPGGTETWFIVNRTINGSTVRTVERMALGWRMEDPDDGSDDQEDAFYVDSGLTYDSTPATEIFGLNHLLGETVQILADGYVVPDAVVADIGEGRIGVTLDTAASVVAVGLGYESILRTMPLEMNTQLGTTMGETKAYGEVRVRLWQTVGAIIGGDLIPFRDGSDLMDTAVPLFSGIKRVPQLGWSRERQLEISQTLPLPLNVLSISGDVELAL